MVTRLTSATVALFACLLYGCIADTMNQKVLADDLQVGLRSVVDIIATGERAEVLFYLENTGGQPVRILPWNTPLAGELTADIFDISIGGESLQYQGIMIKRPAPAESDYTAFAVGERREVVVDLAESYDMSAVGSYRVRLRTFTDQTLMQIGGVAATIVSDDITIVRE